MAGKNSTCDLSHGSYPLQAAKEQLVRSAGPVNGWYSKCQSSLHSAATALASVTLYLDELAKFYSTSPSGNLVGESNFPLDIWLGNQSIPLHYIAHLCHELSLCRHCNFLETKFYWTDATIKTTA